MNSGDEIYTEKLDVTGHKCPVPVLRLRRQLERMAPQTILRLEASDPMTQIDVPYFCQQNGHSLMEMSEENGSIIFLIRAKYRHEPPDTEQANNE